MDLKHHFLIAMPGLAGDYFAHSLTYICEHSDEGAMGIIVNRPGPLSLLELFAQLNLPANHKWVDTPVLVGGPVAPDRGIVLHSSEKQFASSTALGHGLCLSTAMEVLDSIAADAGPEKFLVAVGYAGWGAGQLEEEMARNAWLTTAASNDVLFSNQWEQKLESAARSLGIDIRLIAGQAGHA